MKFQPEPPKNQIKKERAILTVKRPGWRKDLGKLQQWMDGLSAKNAAVRKLACSWKARDALKLWKMFDRESAAL